jgi:hypothetical protein
MLNKEFKRKVDSFLSSGKAVFTIENDLKLKDDPRNPSGSLGFLRMERITHYYLGLAEILKDDPKLYEYILYHEYGHAYYKHNLYLIKNYNKIVNFLKTNRDYIENMAKDLSMTESQVKRIFSAEFIFYLMNIAADMQINSTILNHVCTDYIDSVLKSKVEGFDRVVNPDHYKFLRGRSFEYYIIKILDNIKEFLPKNLTNGGGTPMESSINGEGPSTESSSNSEESSEVMDERGTDKYEKPSTESEVESSEESSPQGGFFGPEMKDELENSGDFDEEGNYVGKDGNLRGEYEEEGEGSSVNTNSALGNRYSDRDSHSWDPYGKSETNQVIVEPSNILNDFDELFENLKSSKEVRFTTHRNLIKNQLKGRHKEMFVPSLSMKYQNVLVEKMMFLVDVSGSMYAKSIFGIINEIANKVRVLGLKSVTLVTWNTGKVEQIELTEFEEDSAPLKIGGGNDLAQGIKYCDSINHDKAPLVLITDCGDNIPRMNDEWEKLSYPKFLVTTNKVYARGVTRNYSEVSKTVKILESDYE